MSIFKSITVRVLGITLLVLASSAGALADAVDDFVRAQMKAGHIPGWPSL
jgi:hypothetical protein